MKDFDGAREHAEIEEIESHNGELEEIIEQRIGTSVKMFKLELAKTLMIDAHNDQESLNNSKTREFTEIFKAGI